MRMWVQFLFLWPHNWTHPTQQLNAHHWASVCTKTYALLVWNASGYSHCWFVPATSSISGTPVSPQPGSKFSLYSSQIPPCSEPTIRNVNIESTAAKWVSVRSINQEKTHKPILIGALSCSHSIFSAWGSKTQWKHCLDIFNTGCIFVKMFEDLTQQLWWGFLSWATFRCESFVVMYTSCQLRREALNAQVVVATIHGHNER